VQEDGDKGAAAAAPMKEHEHQKNKPVTEEQKRREADEDDPLKEMLTGFFFTFNDFEKEFQDKTRKSMVDGSPVYEAIKALYEKTQAEEPPSEEELQAELDKIDLKSVGAARSSQWMTAIQSGRVLAVFDIIEELYMIPKMPVKELHKLETQWNKGEMDSVTVFERLQELHLKKELPSGWLQVGVDKQEKEEEREEIEEETAWPGKLTTPAIGTMDSTATGNFSVETALPATGNFSV